LPVQERDRCTPGCAGAALLLSRMMHSWQIVYWIYSAAAQARLQGRGDQTDWSGDWEWQVGKTDTANDPASPRWHPTPSPQSMQTEPPLSESLPAASTSERHLCLLDKGVEKQTM
jgi:hypothetical protein